MSIYIFANTKIEVNRAVVRSKNFILIEGMFGMNAAVSEREDLNNFFWFIIITTKVRQCF